MRPLTISALASPLGASGSARNATLSPSGGEETGPARLLTLGEGTDPARPLTLTLSPSGGEGIGAPSPSLRERAGVRVGTTSRTIPPRDEPRRRGDQRGGGSKARAVRALEWMAPRSRPPVPPRALRLPGGAAPLAERGGPQRSLHRPALRAPLRLVPLRRRAPDHAQDLRVGHGVLAARRLSRGVSPGHERCAVAEPAHLLGALAFLDELPRARVRLDGAPRPQRRREQAAGGDGAHTRSGGAHLQPHRRPHRHDARP